MITKIRKNMIITFMFAWVIVLLSTGCDTVGNAFDELSMQADLLLYGDEAKEYYAETLDARKTFNQKKAEFNNLCDDAKKQLSQNDRTPLESSVTWKFLWVRCHDVEFDGMHYRLTDKQITYIVDAVESFDEKLEDASDGNIKVECFFEDVEYTLYAGSDDEDTGVYLRLEDTQNEINLYGLPGAYDVVIFLSGLSSDSFAGICNLSINHGYGYANVFLPDDTDYDYQTRPSALYTTTVAMHEFIHMLGGYNAILGTTIIPDPDEAPKYNAYQHYTGDARAESFVFYDDILRGNVKLQDKKYLGMYPHMWRITPRYLVQIGALEYVSNLVD